MSETCLDFVQFHRNDIMRKVCMLIPTLTLIFITLCNIISWPVQKKREKKESYNCGLLYDCFLMGVSPAVPSPTGFITIITCDLNLKNALLLKDIR